MLKNIPKDFIPHFHIAMSMFHILFEEGETINTIADDIMKGFPNIDCQITELLEFFRSDFLVLPNETLWMPFDERIENHSKVSLLILIYDFGVYQRAIEHFSVDAWQSRDDLITFADENGGVALSIFITLLLFIGFLDCLCFFLDVSLQDDCSAFLPNPKEIRREESWHATDWQNLVSCETSCAKEFEEQRASRLLNQDRIMDYIYAWLFRRRRRRCQKDIFENLGRLCAKVWKKNVSLLRRVEKIAISWGKITKIHCFWLGSQCFQPLEISSMTIQPQKMSVFCKCIDIDAKLVYKTSTAATGRCRLVYSLHVPYISRLFTIYSLNGSTGHCSVPITTVRPWQVWRTRRPQKTRRGRRAFVFCHMETVGEI